MEAILNGVNSLTQAAAAPFGDSDDGSDVQPFNPDDQGSGRFYLLNLNYTNPISHIFATYCLFVFTAVILSVFSLAFIGVMNRFIVGIENSTNKNTRKKRSVTDIEDHVEQILRLLHEMDESLRRMHGGKHQEEQKLLTICQVVQESTKGKSLYRTPEVAQLLAFLDQGRNMLEDQLLASSVEEEKPLQALQDYVAAAHLGASGASCDRYGK